MPPAPVRVCFVCSGNICRSPMGEVVLTRMAEDADLTGLVVATSAGTGDWHIGERADRRTLTALAARGYDGGPHRARLFEPQWLPELDLVLALDRGHHRTLRGWTDDAEEQAKVRLLRSFDPQTAALSLRAASGEDVGRSLDVPDPYYSDLDAFDLVLDQVERACAGLLVHLQAQLGVEASDHHGSRSTRGTR
ncbi:low molecular weight protein-tyrosine-phosphatase [Aquipuribacter sp. MA13-6]|uniref:low molecular weight protein-tyrosine-phosphatase n=1 Tax=unclassified Aquipuribacter TaxID=2635084 RepID=UPI003EEF541A